MQTRKKKTRNIKIALTVLIFLMVGAVIALFSGYRNLFTDTKDLVSAPAQEEASISLDTIHQTATKDGQKQWSLDAEKVRYMQEKDQAILEEISVTFYPEPEKAEPIRLTADQGVLHIDTKDIDVMGNVVVENSSYRLETENLRYEHAVRAFKTTSPVHIQGLDFSLAADGMSFDMETRRTEFTGNVKGTIRENLSL